MNRLNSEKFHNFSFEPKFAIFEGKSQKLELGWIHEFLQIHPIYDFFNFSRK